MVNSFTKNQIPSNWLEFFKQNAISYVDEDFNSTNFYTTSMSNLNEDQQESLHLSLSNQRESSHPSLPNQREPLHPSVSTQPESIQSTETPTTPAPFSSDPLTVFEIPPTDSATLTVPAGWNSNHKYGTRFWLKHTASIAITPTKDLYVDPLLATFLQSHDIHPILDPTCFQSISPQIDSSSSVKDTLHYGEMIRDNDRTFFEQDMRREVQDLLSTGTVTVVPRSSVPS
jgi:hypothetical protein